MKTALMTLNIAVLEPIPSASVSTATAVKPGFLSNWRSAKRKSSIVEIPSYLMHPSCHLV